MQTLQQVKEIPILFSTPMVQAIIAGRKTVTRRIMNPQIEPCQHELYQEADWKNEPTKWIVKKGFAYCEYCGNGVTAKNDYSGIRCRYGQPGSVLWVRESYCPGYFDDGRHGYKADWDKTAAEYCKEPKWKPSIHMRKEHARIWLRLDDVRVERLQEISEDDAIAEGIERVDLLNDGVHYHWKDYLKHPTAGTILPINSYRSLWESINGPESWSINPFVWVLSYSVLSTTGKPVKQ